MLLKGAKILNENFQFEFKDIELENGKIKKISSPDKNGQKSDIELDNLTIIPGLIDVHIHGCDGVDTMEGELEKMSIYLAKNGITSFLPTTMTTPVSEITKILKKDINVSGANILGFHLEGPYINTKYKGAQNESYVKLPDITDFEEFREKIKMITIAPEIENAMEFIREATESYAVSLGHTDTDYDTAIKAIENGASCVTHLYNAMKGIHHREPNLIGAAFMKNIYAQIICDGIHIHKTAIHIAYKLFSDERLVLISDSLSACGLSDGIYTLGGQRFTVADGIARIDAGNIAGSTKNLWQCVKKAYEFDIPIESAIKMATRTPALLIGAKNKGIIKEGCDADLVIINKNLDVAHTIISGKII